jgi:hypothetical protein
MEDIVKTIWLPHALYQVIPPLYIVAGLMIAAISSSAQNPWGILLATGMYGYAFVIMLKRSCQADDEEESG